MITIQVALFLVYVGGFLAVLRLHVGMMRKGKSSRSVVLLMVALMWLALVALVGLLSLIV